MPPSQVRLRVPEPSFTLFDAERDGLPEIIVVNEALLSFQHSEIFAWHLLITQYAQELVENGMPSPDESALLFEIGDELETEVLGGRTEHGGESALFLARSTWNGRRETRFVVHNPEISHARLQFLMESRVWTRPWEYHMEADPEWTRAGFVFQLFPQANGRDA